MSDITFNGHFAEFKLAEIDDETANLLNTTPQGSNAISTLFSSMKHRTHQGFKLDTIIIYNNKPYHIDDSGNVYHGLKRIPTKNKTMLFYGRVWKDSLNHQTLTNDETPFYDLPFEVTEYRLKKDVIFKLIDVPKDYQPNPPDTLTIENASLKYANGHLIDLIVRVE
jgi:hypothetical protein